MTSVVAVNIFLYLIPLLILVLILIAIFVMAQWRRGSRRIYKPKGPYLLSEGERILFEALEHCVSSDMYICPKVRIADLVEMAITKDDKEFWPRFNRISQKHVDFVLCKRSSFAPILVIEMDGGSHNDPSRALRDQLVDAVFRDAKIPILHIKASRFYPYKELAEQIAEATKLAQIAL